MRRDIASFKVNRKTSGYKWPQSTLVVVMATLSQSQEMDTASLWHASTMPVGVAPQPKAVSVLELGLNRVTCESLLSPRGSSVALSLAALSRTIFLCRTLQLSLSNKITQISLHQHPSMSTAFRPITDEISHQASDKMRSSPPASPDAPWLVDYR